MSSERKSMKKRVCLLISIVTLIMMLGSTINASEIKTRLDIIQEFGDIKYLEKDQGYISKKIVDFDSDEGKITIELKIENSKKDNKTESLFENTEVYIIISENIVNDTDKFNQYVNDISNLSSKILKRNSKTQIGIIGMTGTIKDITIDEDGKHLKGEDDESDVKGDENNSEIVVELTNDIEKIKEGLNNMNSSKQYYYTNLQSAIRLANKSYSNSTNKILISLYDDVPSIAIGVESEVSYGGLFDIYSSVEEAVVAKHEKIASYTKKEILKLEDSSVSFILLRPDDTSYDEEWYSKKTGEKVLDFDGSPYVKMLYGTIDNPTYGKMYSFNDESIDTIIKNNIYQDMQELIQSDITSVKIEDYFPIDITENFEFSYIEEPNLGDVSKSINDETNSIIWNIEELKGNEEAYLKYQLKIKDMKNEKLLNRVISTNEMVILSYKDTDDNNYEITLSKSPQIKLLEINEDTADVQNITYNEEEDNTIAKDKYLPQTGIGALTVVLIGLIAVAIISKIKCEKYKEI